GDVGGGAGLGRERQPDELPARRSPRRRRDEQAHPALASNALGQLLEGLGGGGGVQRRGGDGFDGRRRRGRFGGVLALRLGLQRHQLPLEAELSVDAPELPDVAPAVAQRRQVELDGAVLFQRDQLLAQKRLIAMGGQRLLELL